MNRVLVTGATGSFGRAFTRTLLEQGVDAVCVYSRDEHKQAAMMQEFGNDERLRMFIGDVRDLSRLCQAMKGCDVVVHAAALKRIEVGHYNPMEMVKTNIGGAMNVIDAATSAGVFKVVALSTDKAFQPVSAYGHSKALAETLFLNANNTRGADGPRFSVTRYGNVWKSAGSIVPKWQALIADGAARVPVTDPECTRFFMTMDEAVGLVLDTILNKPGGVTAIPDLPAYRVGDLAQAMGVETEVKGLPCFEKLHESMGPRHCSEDARRMTVDELRRWL